MNPETVRNYTKKFHEDSLVTEYGLEVTCSQLDGCVVRNLYSMEETIQDKASHVLYFESGWGKEYTPVQKPLVHSMKIENRKGRSSADIHPQVLIFTESGAVYSYAIAWSGNWAVEIEAHSNSFTVKGGLSDWDFATTLSYGETIAAPKVIASYSASGSINDISRQYHKWSRTWIPENELADAMPVEWNHWWAYEDMNINEDVFIQNVDIAAFLGIEVCTLDAGWFGSDREDEPWFDVRGDWHKVNKQRFPSGIRYLSDYVHSKGMKFGLWCEIEGLGKNADLCSSHPQFVAKHDDEFLGYVCLGSQESQDWAYETLAGLISRYQCDWIKLDFNLDPGYGCNCEHHGHGKHDGLFKHYVGLYNVLERIRTSYPNVLLENCSSGGQRTDLGIMQHTHMNFLSDPDYSEHQLQTLWAATLSIPPQQCLHWVWSNTCGTEETRPFPSLDLSDPSLSDKQLTNHMRIAMLHSMGFSHRLPLYDSGTLERMKKHIDDYKHQLRDIIRDSEQYKLTAQTVRGGLGSRWNVYQYWNPKRNTGVLLAFRLKGSEDCILVNLEGLRADERYTIVNADTSCVEHRLGSDYTSQGITIEGLQPDESYLMYIWPENMQLSGDVHA